MSLQIRVVRGLLVWMAGVFLLLSMILPAQLERSADYLTGELLGREASLLSLSLEPLLAKKASGAALKPFLEAVSRRLQAQVDLFSADGLALVGSNKARPVEGSQEVEEARMWLAGEPVSPFRGIEGDRMRLALPVVRGGRLLGVLVLSVPLEPAQRRNRAICLRVYALFGLFGLGTLILTARMGGAFSRILRQAIDLSRRIAEGEFTARARIPAQDETGELARTLNATARSLGNRFNTLRESEQTMRAAFAHMADGVVVLDPLGRIVLYNAVAEEVFGRSARRAKGRTLLDLTTNSDLDALVTHALRTGEPTEGEVQLRWPSSRILGIFISPVPDEEETPLGGVLVFRDLTEIRRLENVRRDFVTNASHELKTPLATIRVMVDTLRGGMSDDPVTERRFLETIGGEVERMGALVDDLLDLSRIEAGHFKIEPEVFALAEPLASAVAVFRPLAEKRSQALETDLQPDALVWADPQAVVRMASNLIENAQKYTHDGGRIAVSCGREGDEAFFAVADTGVGIPEAEKNRIFERFYRVDKARSRATGGTGLGLSIVKHLAEAQGGRVEVESAPGRGSRFTVWLPALKEDDWRE